MKKVTRREVGKMVAAAAAAGAARGTRAQAPRPGNYIGPLTGVDPAALQGRQLDPVAYTLQLYGSAPRQLRFQARTRSEAEAWQKKLRAKLVELVGGFPSPRVPLKPALLESRTFPGYRREKIVFDTRQGLSALAYVLIPAARRLSRPWSASRPRPRRRRYVGIDDKGQDRTDKAGLSARLCAPGGRGGDGGGGDRAHRLRRAARSDHHQEGQGTSACQPGRRRRCWWADAMIAGACGT